MSSTQEPQRPAQSQGMAAPEDTLRVMTLNMWHSDVVVADRLAAAAAEIVARAPHMVNLQEVRFGATSQSTGDFGDTASALAALTGMSVATSGSTFPIDGAARSGVAVLTTLEVTTARTIALPGRPSPYMHASLAWLVAPSGRPVLSISTHLAWGSRTEVERVAQAVAIDELVEVEVTSRPGLPAPVVILAGDFNTGPNSDTLRFLTGEGVAHGRGTLWLDTWAIAGHGPGITSGPGNGWAATTAAEVGISNPALLPNRRIDFILVQGWAYGRHGCPLAATVRFNELAGPALVLASDHYGLEVDLWDPPLT